MKKYLSFFRIRFINGLQYRAAAYAGVATQFAWGALELLAFAAFYRADPAAFPMEFSQLSSYIWLQQAFLALFMTWFFDGSIMESITSGNVAYELARPMDLYNMWFVKNAAIRLSKAVLRCTPVLVVAFFLPAPYGITLPPDFISFLAFCVTMAIGLFVVIAFGMLVCIATFYTLNSLGVRVIAISLADIFTGALVPLPFLPDGVRAVFELTPFAAMQNIPLRVYSGNISGEALLWSIALQLFWAVVLILLGKLWMKQAVKKVIVQGG